MRTQRSSSSGGRVRNIRRRRQRVGDGVPATHGTRRQPASGNEEPTVADEQLSYSSDVPEPRRASDGGDETTGTATCSAVVG